jgi:hypothetical protein
VGEVKRGKAEQAVAGAVVVVVVVVVVAVVAVVVVVAFPMSTFLTATDVSLTERRKRNEISGAD